MNADPVCVQRERDAAVAGNLRSRQRRQVLANVFVYVKDGLGNYVVRHADRVRSTIDQKDCRYHPHVFGMRVGQPLEIVNSDPTLHNIHALPKGNTEFNTGQPIQGMKTTHTFTAKEVMVPFKCDVHGWMNAYVGVLDHPYFAVTDDGRQVRAEGRCRPAPTRSRRGTRSSARRPQQVTLGAKETKDVELHVQGPAAATN